MNIESMLPKIENSLKIHLKDYLDKFDDEDKKLFIDSTINYGALELSLVNAKDIEDEKRIKLDMAITKRTLENLKLAGEISYTKEIASLVGSLMGIVAKEFIKTVM